MDDLCASQWLSLPLALVSEPQVLLSLLLGLGVSLVVLFAVLLACHVHRYGVRPYRAFSGTGIPGPPPRLPFGNAWKFIVNKDYTKLYLKDKAMYGPVLGYYLGTQPLVVMGDVEAVQEICVSQFKNFMNRPDFLLSMRLAGLPLGLLEAQGQDWRSVRRSCTPAFTGKKMKDISFLVEENSAGLLKKLLQDAALSQDSVDVFEAFGTFSMEIAMSLTFGIQFGTQDKQFRKALVRAVSYGRSGLLSYFASMQCQIVMDSLLPFLRPLLVWLQPARATGDFAVLSDRCLALLRDRVKDSSEKKKDLLSFLIADPHLLTKGSLGSHQWEQHIIAHCITLLLAAYETTATTMSFMAYQLARHPEVQERLCSDIHRYFAGNKDASLFSASQDVEYLEMVVSETLRCHPPGDRIPRMCGKRTKVGRWTIPEGSWVVIPALMLHHDPQAWKDPHRFNPHRFSAEESQQRPNGYYLPFGVGPRNCLGSRFALLAIKMAFCDILRSHKFVVSSKTKIPPHTGSATFSMAPTEGIYLGVEKLNTV